MKSSKVIGLQSLADKLFISSWIESGYLTPVNNSNVFFLPDTFDHIFAIVQTNIRYFSRGLPSVHISNSRLQTNRGPDRLLGPGCSNESPPLSSLSVESFFASVVERLYFVLVQDEYSLFEI